MTKEEIKKFLDNTKVYVNGKSREIQEKLFSFGYDWSPINHRVVKHTIQPFLFIYENGIIAHGNKMGVFTEHEHREISADETLSLEITEPSYRPFKTKEECWNEMSKHQPLGWIYDKANNSYTLRISISGPTCFERLFNEYSFADGTPFGIKEE